ncbi:MAG: 30S ribosomal protein S6 [candidate division Zixibacteria bacterium]|nr:30S ribosomal protein S6 [candidate division Zixibacteria bacterium]
MRLYETTFIINPQTDDAAIERQVKDVTDLIANRGGEIVHENRMGTRRLAYAIGGLTQGYYATLIFKAPTELLTSLERHFRLGEAYLRNLTIIFEGDLERLKEPKEVEERFRPAPRTPRAGRPDRPFGRRETTPRTPDKTETADKPETPVETKPPVADTSWDAPAPVEPEPQKETATDAIAAEETKVKAPEPEVEPTPKPAKPAEEYLEDEEL